jgi:hypothetical protein
MSSSIGQWFKNLSEEEIRKVNEIERKKAEEDYKKFKEAFSRGMCSLCGSPLSTISREKPCLHWLLRQCKFKKKDFKLLYPTISYFQMNAYLRWVANQDVYMKNINDLTDEKNPSKIIETTIKYKHIEWSFSCSQSDFEGHKGSKADFPHYHFQMRIDGRPFIDYTDYHIPFLESDIFNFVLIKNHGAIESYGLGGVGMQSGISLEPEDIINSTFADQTIATNLDKSIKISKQKCKELPFCDIMELDKIYKKGRSLQCPLYHIITKMKTAFPQLLTIF